MQGINRESKSNGGVSEVELLQQARVSGLVGERARSALVQQHYPWMQARCRQVLRNEADALDAAQEAALLVYRHLPKFEGRSTLRTWVGTIATRQCMSLMRRQQRLVLVDHLEELIDLHESYLHEQFQDVDESSLRVEAALRALGPRARDVLGLRFYSDLSLEDISHALGISLSAAKMRLYRALEQFEDAYALSA